MLVLDGEHPVARLAFTPDNARLVVARAQWYPAEMWPSEVRSLATGERVPLKTPGAKLYPELAVHSSGRFAFFTYRRASWSSDAKLPLSVVSLTDGTEDTNGAHNAWVVIASPDGKWVVTRGDDPHTLIGYSCDPDAKPVCAQKWLIELSAAGDRLGGFINAGAQFVTVGYHRIVIRDTDTGAVRDSIRQPAPSVANAATAPAAGRLAVQSSTQFYLWDTETWAEPAQFAADGRRTIASYAFHPTQPVLAAIQYQQAQVKFLDTATGKVIRKFQWKLGELRAVCFSPDGTLAAAGAANGKIVVWDVDE